jgi:hypothetical protein
VSIVSSVIVETDVQKDGRKWVHEVHVDQLGLKYERNYLAGAADDLNVALAAYAVLLANVIQANEINTNLGSVVGFGSLATYTLNYSTAAQNFAALRIAYHDATQTQAIMIGDFLSSLTDVQLENAFGLTQAQVTALRSSKLTPAVTAAATIRATTGA